MRPGRRVGSHRPVLLLLLGGLGLVLALAGCRAPVGEDGAAGPAVELRVLAAASLTEVLTELAASFEAERPGVAVRLSFGASSTLAQQLVRGAPADVFASASTTSMAVAVGEVEEPVVVARNAAALAVFPGSRARVGTLQDLGHPEVTVALCETAVPCGQVAAALLRQSGTEVTPVTRGLDVRSVLATVISGEVDAGIVYATDVRAAGDSVVSVPLPTGTSAVTDYPVAVVRGSDHAPLARAFVAHLRSDAGDRVLAAAGFVPV